MSPGVLSRAAGTPVDPVKLYSSYLQMGALGVPEGLDGQVDQKAQACQEGPQLHYLPSVPDGKRGRACNETMT